MGTMVCVGGYFSGTYLLGHVKDTEVANNNLKDINNLSLLFLVDESFIGWTPCE